MENSNSDHHQSELYRKLLDFAGLGIGFYDPDGTCLLMNRVACEVLNKSESELIGKSCTEIFGEELADLIRTRFGEVISKKTILTYEDKLELQNGLAWWSSIYTGICDNSGNVIGIQIISENITQRKNIESQNFRLQRAIENSLNGFLIVNQDALIEYVNQAALVMCGYESATELTGRDPDVLFEVKEDAMRLKNELDTNGTAIMETIGRRKDGTLFYVLVYFRREVDFFGNIIYHGSTIDISKLKNTEQELLRSLNSVESIISNSPLGMLIYRFEAPDRLILVETNKSAAYFLGIDLSASVGKEFRKIWPETVADSNIFSSFLNVYTTGLPYTEDIEYSDNRISGAYRTHVFKLSDEGIAVVFEDISESMEALHTLKESEARYRELIEKSGVAIAVDDVEGDIVYFNRDFAELFGYTVKEMRGKTRSELIHPDYIDEVDIYHWSRMNGKDAPGQYEVKGVKKDGTPLWLEVKTTVLEEESGFSGTRMYIWDITERKEAEQRLQRSNSEISRLSRHIEAVREEEQKRLSSILHDDIGQLLTAIKMDAAWIRSNATSTEDKMKERAGSVIEIVDQALSSIQQMTHELRPPAIDNLGLIAAIENLVLNYQVRSTIKFELDLPEKRIEADPALLTSVYRIVQEALTNIVRHSGATAIKIRLKVIGNTLDLLIEDNGAGIDVECLESHNSFGIISMRERTIQWSGEFIIEGVKGKGTKVMVSLPLKSPV